MDGEALCATKEIGGASGWGRGEVLFYTRGVDFTDTSGMLSRVCPRLWILSHN